MIGANDFLRPYFVSAMRDLQDEIAEQIAPFCRNKKHAEQFVAQMPIIAQFQQWMNNGNISMDHRSMVKRLVPVIKNILAGKEFWTFEEQPNH